MLTMKSRPLTDIDYHLLGVLHVDGPAANILLADKTALSPPACYQRLYRLRRLGHVSHGRTDKLYRLTELGQEALARRPQRLPGLTRTIPGLLPGTQVKKPPTSEISSLTSHLCDPAPRRRKLIHIDSLTPEQAGSIHQLLRADVARGLKFAWTRLMCFDLPTFGGLRADEAAGLNLGDVDLLGRDPVIRIRREITKSKAGVRKVPLYWNRRFLEDVRDYLLFRCQLSGISDPAHLHPDEPFIISLRSRYVPPPGSGAQSLFDFIPSAERRAPSADPVACHGKRIDRDTVRKCFRTACSRVIDLQRYRLTTHTGRHTFCSLALGPGRRTLAQVKDAAGHSNISITSRYLHALRDAGDEDCFAGVFGPAVSTPAGSTQQSVVNSH